MKKFLLPLAALCYLCLAVISSPPAGATEIAAQLEGAALRGNTLHLKVTVGDLGQAEPIPVEIRSGARLLGTFPLDEGEHSLKIENAHLGASDRSLTVSGGGATAEIPIRTLSAWLSVVPPVAAILLALVFRDVLISLFSGIFLGALLLNGWNPLTAFGRSIDQFVISPFADPSKVKILVFSSLLGAMVGLMAKSGGTRGVVEKLSPMATNTRRGQLATWLMGLVVFFDDYANALIVGSTMRPVTDRLKISREKLAFIVDSTAAPVASVFPISTWIGFEVGLIGGAFTTLSLPYDPYVTFLASIPFRFYPILMLVLGLTIAWTCKDLGPMLKAEQRAFRTGEVLAQGHTALADYDAEGLEPPPGIPHRAVNAALPVLTVIGVTLWGLVVTGAPAVERSPADGLGLWLRDVLSNADSYNALLWASLSGTVVALLLAVGTRSLPLVEAMKGLVSGLKAMLLALVVLVLAWVLGSVCTELHTADYLVQITQGEFAPHWLPVIVFALAASVAFATGTSWATMSILIPLVIPVLDGLARGEGLTPGDPTYTTLLLGTVSSVLAGAVWGDHCSPISDTTILSAVGSGTSLVEHVRTQAPYALSAGVLALVCGYLPVGLGVSVWACLAVGSVATVALVLVVGRPVPPADGQRVERTK
ncbi:MAG: Na+/H+ antiporter NhaC family protein [Acidobacteria bacterium]|nr:Na+/H+ antiporter NhaC family protein [Acidobacteriota bacterium]